MMTLNTAFTSSIFILIDTASCYEFSRDKLHHVIFELQYQFFWSISKFWHYTVVSGRPLPLMSYAQQHTHLHLVLLQTC